MKSKAFVLLLFLMQVTMGASCAQNSKQATQEYTLVFKGIMAKNAIEKLVKASNIDLIYDPSLLDHQRIYGTSRNETAKKILANILHKVYLDYVQLSSGTYVIIGSVQLKPHFNNLTGRVFDKETGKPLGDANVYLENSSAGAATNEYGRFNIAPLISGKYEVNVTYVGYRSVQDTVTVPAKSKKSNTFYLEPKPVFVKPIVVSSMQRKLSYPEDDHDQIKKVAEHSSSYSAMPDALKSMNSIMGVDFSLPLADFHVQGGAAGENRVLLDGTPVYNPVSLGRLTGAFSPYALRNIKVYKGGFGADIGSQLSGVISVKQDIANKSDNNLLVEADPLSVNIRGDFTKDFGDGKKLKTMLALRGNVWPVYQKQSLANSLEDWDQLDPLVFNSVKSDTANPVNFNPVKHKSDITFYDIHFTNYTNFNEFNTASLSFYRGKNYLQTKLLSRNINLAGDEPSLVFTRDTYDNVNTVAHFRDNWLMSSRLDATLGLSYSRHHARHHFGIADNNGFAQTSFNAYRTYADAIAKLSSDVTHLPETGDKNSLTEISLNTKFEYSLRPNHTLNVGFKPTYVKSSFTLSDLYYRYSSTGNAMYMLAGFVQDKLSINRQTTLKGGARFTYLPDHHKILTEPRISIQKDIPNTKLGFVSLKLSGGLYRQFINQFDVTNVGPSTIVPSNRFWLSADHTTSIPKSYHANAEVLVQPTKNLSIRANGYYKWYPTILAINYHTLLNNSTQSSAQFDKQYHFITSAKRYNYGAGLSVEQFIESLNMKLSASYQHSIVRQKNPDRFDGEYTPTPWNEPHQLTAALSWNIIPPVTMHMKWQSIWGQSWAYNRAYYDYLSLSEHSSSYGDYKVNTPADDKKRAFQQLDFAIGYSRHIQQTKLSVQLNISNVLNRKNLFEKRIQPQRNSEGNTNYTTDAKMLPGFTPSFNVQFSF